MYISHFNCKYLDKKFLGRIFNGDVFGAGFFQS